MLCASKAALHRFTGLSNRLQYIPHTVAIISEPTTPYAVASTLPGTENAIATAVIDDPSKARVTGYMYHKDYQGGVAFTGANLHRVAFNLRELTGMPGRFVSAIPGMPDSDFERFAPRRALDPLGDTVSSVSLLPTIQDDLTITNAARVSFNKQSNWFTKITQEKRSDEGLLNFLVRKNHWTPISQVNFLFKCSMDIHDYVRYSVLASKYQMSHCITSTEGSKVEFFERGSAYAYLQLDRDGMSIPQEIRDLLPYTIAAHVAHREQHEHVKYTIDRTLMNDHFLGTAKSDFPLPAAESADLFTLTFRVKVPIFVARQLGKHQIDMTTNEVSRRYVSDKPDCYTPKVFREHNADIKQGSKDTQVPHNDMAYLVTRRTVETSLAGYSALLDSYNVCREQSRIVLPQSTYTEYIQTGTVSAYQRLLGLRLAPDAQWEVRQYAKAILSLAKQSEHARFFSHILDPDTQ